LHIFINIYSLTFQERQVQAWPQRTNDYSPLAKAHASAWIELAAAGGKAD
jgi:hypothetical protein